jgi:O-antigen/teichoic acid export membrane protein
LGRLAGRLFGSDKKTMTMPENESGNVVVAAEESLSAPAIAPGETVGLRAILPSNLPFDRVSAWAVRGGVSILQQGLFAGSQFLANVLLARWLPPASYGVFALAYSFFLLLLLLYVALFNEPMLVYGAGRYSGEFSAYVRVLVRLHFMLLLPAGLLIALAAPLLGKFYAHEFRVAFLSLAVLSPLLLLIWLCRAAFYAQLNPHAGAMAGGCYFALLVVSIWLLEHFGALSPSSGLGGMAGASLFVSMGCLYQFRKERAVRSNPELGAARVLSDHWRYGKWAVLTAIASWIPANIYYALLPARFGLESVATLRALMNLMYPLLHTMIALVLLLIPILVRQRERDGLSTMKRTILQLVVIFIPVGVLYLVCLVAFRHSVLHLLYAGRYVNVSPWTIVWIGMLPITGGLVGLLGAGLRSLERPHLIFWSYLASAVVALSVGIRLAFRYGVPGAAFALALNDMPAIAVLAVFLARAKGVGGTSRSLSGSDCENVA